MKIGETAKRWLRRDADLETCTAISSKLSLPQPIVSILLSRGLKTAEEINDFLNPTLAQLPSPFLMKGMRKAVEILHEALLFKKSIIIYGDYDVDGATGVAVLALFLKSLNLQVTWFQPSRFSDGYGFHFRSIVRAGNEKGSDRGVVITVDCGISDGKDIAEARKSGFSVIVTDHHKPPEELPEADAILNPLQPGCTFPFKGLAGVGVAFYLIMGLRSHLVNQKMFSEQEAPNLKSYLDLVALGTVADMVPLLGPNRILTKAGLQVMAKAERPGIRSLLDVSGLDDRSILRADDISFRLGPRINAAGRVGDAARALELFVTDSNKRAKELAVMLDADNNERKEISESLYGKAYELAKRAIEQGTKSLIIVGDNWHNGVLGIVASRLVNEFFRPVIVLTVSDGTAKGSGRSIPGFDLYKALAGCGGFLEQYGGHSAAVGVTLKADNIKKFKDEFEMIVSETMGEDLLVPTIFIDWQSVNGELSDENFISHYKKLQPFGTGNPEPVFAGKGIVKNPKRIGADGDHLRFDWQEEAGASCEAVGFGYGELAQRLSGEEAEIAYRLRLNSFRGRERWQLNIDDIIESPSP